MTHPTDDSLKPCPFCGAGTTEITPKGRMWTGMKYSEPSSVSVRHWCEAVPGQPSRMIERVGRDEASAIYAWNTRALLAEQARTEPDATPMNFARLKFFRDLNSAERIKVLRVFMDLDGIPDDQIDTHGVQTMLFKNVFATTQPLKAEQAKDAAPDHSAETSNMVKDAAEDAPCVWTQEADPDMGDTYASACGELWSFIDGGPTENRVRFCHGCGKPVQVFGDARAAERKA